MVTDPPVPLTDPQCDRPPPIRAPWTPAQVRSLNEFQSCGYWHEFTCGRCRSPLYARTDGWHCNFDDYAQNWAHAFMTDWSWRRGGPPRGESPEERAARSTRQRSAFAEVAHAVANARLAGVELDDEWIGVLERLARGELTADAAIDLARFWDER